MPLKVPKIPSIFENEEMAKPSNPKIVEDDKKKNFIDNKVTCPVCFKEIETLGNFSFINRHINECLQSNQNAEEKSPVETKHHNAKRSSHDIVKNSNHDFKKKVVKTEKNKTLNSFFNAKNK